MTSVDSVLAFDIWGDYSHFRKIETTTSPLTYSIPTGTALSGIISAIIGLRRDSYYELFHPEHTRIAIRILEPIKKTRINLSLINTKKGFFLWDTKENPRTLIPFEFVRQPKYRIYFWTEHEELYRKLKRYLKRHQSFYTPYLGISELIANFEYNNEYIIEGPQKAEGPETIHSVIRKDRAKLIVEKGKRFALERIPIFMDKHRVVQEYADVFFEVNAQPLKIADGEFYAVGNENVVFL